MNITPPLAPRVLGTPEPHTRTVEEHTALRVLLAHAQEAEAAAAGASRRDAFRVTRSLLAAARALGFTLPALSDMLGITAGSLRNRSEILTPIPRSRFLAILPDHTSVGGTATIEDDELEDPVVLLESYLNVTFAGTGSAAP